MVRALIEQGLSGEEAAVILMHHYWERDNGRKPFMSADDETAIRTYLLNHASDYDLSRFNAWMETYRVVYLTLSECKAATSEICLTISDAMLAMVEQADNSNDMTALLELRLSDLMSAKQVITLLDNATGVPFIEWFDTEFMPRIEKYLKRFEKRFGAFAYRLDEVDVNQETVVYFEERFSLNLGVNWKRYAVELAQERVVGIGLWNKINPIILGKSESDALEIVHA